jgi:hypothetical protein
VQAALAEMLLHLRFSGVAAKVKKDGKMSKEIS